MIESYEILYRTRCKNLISSFKEVRDYQKLNQYESFKDLMNKETFKEIINNKQRRKNKRSRCNKKLKEILLLKDDLDYTNIKNQLLWVTCTFSDDELELKERTRTKKLNQWIKEHFIIALVNIDYGELKKREHYHFIGLTIEDVEPALKEDGTQAKGKRGEPLYNLKKKTYKQGFEPDIEIVCRKDEDYNLKRLSNYLVKINNHYTKETTKHRRTRLIF